MVARRQPTTAQTGLTAPGHGAPEGGVHVGEWATCRSAALTGTPARRTGGAGDDDHPIAPTVAPQEPVRTAGDPSDHLRGRRRLAAYTRVVHPADTPQRAAPRREPRNPVSRDRQRPTIHRLHRCRGPNGPWVFRSSQRCGLPGVFKNSTKGSPGAACRRPLGVTALHWTHVPRRQPDDLTIRCAPAAREKPRLERLPPRS
ncbi:hypothetical protein V6Z77_010180 [Aspergillus fumigatus]